MDPRNHSLLEMHFKQINIQTGFFFVYIESFYIHILIFRRWLANLLLSSLMD